MPLVIAVANEKGGVGKTTTCMNVAGVLTKVGYRVAVIDADRQNSSTAISIARGQSTLPFVVLPVKMLAQRPLSEYDALVASYDVLMVDCPPGLTTSTDAYDRIVTNFLRMATFVIVPMKASYIDFAAAAQFVGFLKPLLSPTAGVGVFMNEAKANRLNRVGAERAAALFAGLPQAIVFRTSIGDRTAITEAAGTGKTILDFAPRHAAAREYTSLTQELLEWLKARQQTPSTSPTSASISPAPQPEAA